MTEETQALVRQLREWVDGQSVTYASVLMQDAAAALTALARDLATTRQERDAALADAAFHADCRPNRRQAEAAYADNKALNDKVADLTAAVRAARAETWAAAADIAKEWLIADMQLLSDRFTERAAREGQ
jgi:hypothetical protein